MSDCPDNPHSNLDGAGADMRSRLVTWEWKSRFKPETTELILDFRENRFNKPWALAQFVAYGLWIKRELGIRVRADIDPYDPANLYVRWVVLGFADVRFATQSFVHVLLSDPVRSEGALLRLSFLHCTQATRQAIQTGCGLCRVLSTDDMIWRAKSSGIGGKIGHLVEPSGGIAWVVGSVRGRRSGNHPGVGVRSDPAVPPHAQQPGFAGLTPSFHRIRRVFA